jgi:hypothetical protein
MVTVALPFSANIILNGAPAIRLAPTTTQCLPSVSILYRLNNSNTPKAVAGRINGSLEIMLPKF